MFIDKRYQSKVISSIIIDLPYNKRNLVHLKLNLFLAVNSPKSSNTGYSLLIQRMLAVWLKLSLVWRRSWYLVILQFVIPTLLLTASLGVLKYILSLVPNIRKRELTLTTGYVSGFFLITLYLKVLHASARLWTTFKNYSVVEI